MNELLLNALGRTSLEVEMVGPTFNIRHGTGPLARSVNVDPQPFEAWLAERSGGDAQRKRDAASWANGILTTLLEPKRSDARNWTFVEAAGSILPTVEGAGFVHGVRDATGGDPAWTEPIDEDLHRAWILRLGRGIRPVTAGQVADWGATPDRIKSAGRSLLFHNTRNFGFRPADDERVLQLMVGDGHDAARLWIVADAFFTEVDDDWRFAIPHPDVVLAVRDTAHVDALRDAATALFEDADYPLDRRIWQLSRGGPKPATEGP